MNTINLNDFVYIICSNALRQPSWGLRQKKEIVTVAAEQAGRRGNSLEDRIPGVEWVEGEDGDFTLNREPSDQEKFDAALEELRDDGHFYNVYEDTAEGRSAFVADLPASLRGRRCLCPV